jgi:hypothetical protein
MYKPKSSNQTFPWKWRQKDEPEKEEWYYS